MSFRLYLGKDAVNELTGKTIHPKDSVFIRNKGKTFVCFDEIRIQKLSSLEPTIRFYWHGKETFYTKAEIDRNADICFCGFKGLSELTYDMSSLHTELSDLAKK